MAPRRRTSTATSNFGVGRRESHDASGFYGRFEAPAVSDDTTIAPPRPLADPFVNGDARKMDELDDNSVALVVTSPPYFAGKQYEQELDAEGVPSSYLEYLDLLHDVFAECVRVLEPGGRIAVNVANLGRKPYRSLSADVVHILQDRLKLLLRGEVVWRKGEGASGSCAWGSFRSPANPTLRDLSERVVVASKGRFDRALKPEERRERGLPHESTITSDEYMAATLDVWDLPPESAKRVQHPAPFPVELPERLIRLYTYVDDLVLDPFMGSGSTLVAAARTGRRYVGYDLDPAYVALARERVAEADALGDGEAELAIVDGTIGAAAKAMLTEAGFTVTGKKVRPRGRGATVPFAVVDRTGASWYVELFGAFTTNHTGLDRAEVAWRAAGRAHALHADGTPVLVLTSHLPVARTEPDLAVRSARPAIFDVAVVGSVDGVERLTTYATRGPARGPLPGFWRAADLDH